MDRRALFFAGAGVVCLLLTPIADAAHRPVSVILGLVYLVLAVLSALDRRTRSMIEPRTPPTVGDDTPS